ncbi:SUMF1/EgtB/PvdO family nonheme iron enzyme [uncultured Thiodictyon sp.]|uniref:SUMF1/EgtB/PvdO family nonheme iron enzyme n=1 Tax=uncultured Thiodictyon sp. TaxID=1846217 RepID=UPI0025EE9877|nr:SUMF1/EgtB/PvdO family nonheme iron enzyme [uncultured Thiodictyon sp.]
MRRSLTVLGTLLPLALADGRSARAASGLMVRCDISGAQVTLNGSPLGTCPGKFTPPAGRYTLGIQQGIDADSEWVYAKEIVLTDGEITKIEATLTKRPTAAFAERQRLAAEEKRQAQLRRYEEERPARAQWAERLSGEFVTIKGGCFRMGDVFGDGGDNERPVHKVCVKGFKLAKYEVTQWQWRQVMGSNPAFSQYCGDDCPVEQVSFDDIQAFIAKLNAQTGLTYRLPNEAEWEYACRSGGKDQCYCGGDDLGALAWYGDNSGRKSHPVGAKQANGLGLYDMSGNVREWTCSADQERTADSENTCSGNHEATAGRMLRGGSWGDDAWLTRAWLRVDYVGALVVPKKEEGMRLAQDL